MIRGLRRLVAAIILPLLLTLTAPLTVATASSANGAAGQTTVVDDLGDFGKITARSGNLGFERTNTSFLGNDSSRLARGVRKAEWAVWSQPGMRSFTAITYFWPSEQVQHFTFAASADKVAYTTITPTMTDRGGDWRRIDYALTLPPGTNHVRVTFPNASAYAWNPQIGRVTYSNVAPAPPSQVAAPSPSPSPSSSPSPSPSVGMLHDRIGGEDDPQRRPCAERVVIRAGH